MAGRNLAELKERYNSASAPGKARGPMGGPGGGPGGGAMRGKSKPKNAKATVKRLFSYISAYKAHMVVVLLCMLISTGSSLVGSYYLRLIFNKINNTYTFD